MTHLKRGEGTVYRVRGSEMVFKATAASTDGAFSFMERELPPGATPSAGVHTHEGPEAFYVLEGTVTFVVGGDEFEGTKGDFVLVPPHVRHAFANATPEGARVLILHIPAADAYFADLQELWSGSEAPSKDAVRDLALKHGIMPA